MTNYSIEERQWWVQRWLELLDSYRFKKRLERARNYTREGHVLSLEVKKSQVIAKVQGSEVEPYQVSLELDLFTDEDWSFVIATLAEKALYSAQLLAGQMPESIEQVFIKNGLNLFPYTLTDIHSYCTCPDQANPCKHIGAIYYQLGDRLSEDPFIMLQLRGRSKEQLLFALRQQRNSAETNTAQKELIAESPITVELDKLEPTPSQFKQQPSSSTTDIQAQFQLFWQYDQALEANLVVISPSQSKSILDVIGLIPLPLEEAEEAKQFLQSIYQTVSQKAVMNGMLVADSSS